MNENIRPFTAHSFNQFLNENKLMASRCPACDQTHIPPRAICPDCFSDQLEWVEMSGKGKLAAYTAITVGPTMMIEQGFDRSNPYLAGIVKLDEGQKISGRLIGFDASTPDNVRIGSPVVVEFIPLKNVEPPQNQLGFRLAAEGD